MPVAHLRHAQPPGQRLLQALPVLHPVGLDLGKLFLRLAALGIERLQAPLGGLHPVGRQFDQRLQRESSAHR